MAGKAGPSTLDGDQPEPNALASGIDGKNDTQPNPWLAPSAQSRCPWALAHEGEAGSANEHLCKNLVRYPSYSPHTCYGLSSNRGHRASYVAISLHAATIPETWPRREDPNSMLAKQVGILLPGIAICGELTRPRRPPLFAPRWSLAWYQLPNLIPGCIRIDSFPH